MPRRLSVLMPSRLQKATGPIIYLSPRTPSVSGTERGRHGVNERKRERERVSVFQWVFNAAWLLTLV